VCRLGKITTGESRENKTFRLRDSLNSIEIAKRKVLKPPNPSNRKGETEDQQGEFIFSRGKANTRLARRERGAFYLGELGKGGESIKDKKENRPVRGTRSITWCKVGRG